MGHARGGWVPFVRYGLPGLALGLIVSWSLGGARNATAQGPPAGMKADGTGTIAFTSAVSAGTQFLYVIDTKAQAFAIYRVDSQKGNVKLEAARPYRWDLKLEYNNLPPEVDAVEAMVSTATKKN